MVDTWRGDEIASELQESLRRTVLKALADGTGTAKQQCYFGHGLRTGTYQRSIGFEELPDGTWIFGSFSGRHTSTGAPPYAYSVNAKQGQIDAGWRAIVASLGRGINA
jgi:hypothetical protein